MHKMSRKKVTVGNDGVSMLMWCDGCKDFVRFYSSGGRVRCASALRNYQNKGKSMDAEEDMIDVSVVNTTNDMVELWSDEQKGHCRLYPRFGGWVSVWSLCVVSGLYRVGRYIHICVSLVVMAAKDCLGVCPPHGSLWRAGRRS